MIDKALKSVLNLFPLDWLKPHPGSTSDDYLSHEKIHSRIGASGVKLRFLPLTDSYTEETQDMRNAYRVMLKEPAVKAALLTKILAVASLDIQVQPSTKRPVDKEAADFVKHALQRCKGGTRAIAKGILLGGCIDGFSVCEKVWQVETRGQYKGKYSLKQLKAKDTFYVDLLGDDYRNITAIRDRRTNQEYHPSNFTVYSHLSLFESPTGMSDLRAAYRAFWLIDTAWQLRAVALEKYTLPMMMGKYSVHDQKAELEVALQNARSQGWITIPADAQVEAMNLAARGTADFEAAIRDLREDMVLAIAGAVLQMLQGQVADGRGNSKVHKGTAELFQWQLAAEVGDIITDQLVPELVDYNFNNAEYPIVTLGGIADETMIQSAQLDQILLQGGLALSKEEIYTKYGRQRPVNEEDTLVSPQLQMMHDQQAMQQQQIQQQLHQQGMGMQGMQMQPPQPPPSGPPGGGPRPPTAPKAPAAPKAPMPKLPNPSSNPTDFDDGDRDFFVSAGSNARQSPAASKPGNLKKAGGPDGSVSIMTGPMRKPALFGDPALRKHCGEGEPGRCPKDGSKQPVSRGYHDIVKSQAGGHVHASGQALDADLHQRVKSLVIPPAWQNVKVAKNPNARLQAMGTDSKGRVQRRYSAVHTDKQRIAKFNRLKDMVKALPDLEAKIRHTIAGPDGPAKDAAHALLVMRHTGFRIGSNKDTKGDVQALGLTQLMTRHAKVRGDTVHFDFVGKHGVRIKQSIKHPDIAATIRQRKVKAGRTGRLFPVSDSTVRSYLKSIGSKFVPKDFRTLVGAETALHAMSRWKKGPRTPKDAKIRKQLVTGIVAKKLGNTPAVAKKSYIPQEVFAGWDHPMPAGKARKHSEAPDKFCGVGKPGRCAVGEVPAPPHAGLSSAMGAPISANEAAPLAGLPHGTPMQIESSPKSTTLKFDNNKLSMERRIRPAQGGGTTVDNIHFDLAPSLQKHGIGAHLFNNQVKELTQRGVKSIGTYAMKDSGVNGYHTWPTLGYDGPLHEHHQSMLPPELAGAKTIQDLYAKPGGKDWWKKHGDSISLSFDLTPGSKSHQVLDSYMAKLKHPAPDFNTLLAPQEEHGFIKGVANKLAGRTLRVHGEKISRFVENDDEGDE